VALLVASLKAFPDDLEVRASVQVVLTSSGNFCVVHVD
jgi:hypothetical protein